MGIETITIVNLRLKTSNTADIYYTTDLGQEGEWYYDAIDTISLDNLGTILVSTNGMRFKRVYDEGFVNATWFGAIGDNSTDNYQAIQNALDFISPTIPPIDYNLGSGTVFLPKGIYKITKTLLIGQNCRLIGVNNRYHYIYQIFPYGDAGGTVIKANFSIEDADNWVISSATYKSGTTDLLPYDITLSRAWSSTMNYSFNNFCYRMGINIENLTIDGGNNNAFGGIRISNAGNSTIRNVGVFNSKCGFLINTCWGGSLENCFVNVIWYGIIVSNCNSFVISDCYTRYYGNNEDLIPTDQLPYFIISDVNNPDPPATGINYNDWDLNDNVKYGITGIFCIHSRSIGFYGNCIELTANGISILNSTASMTSTYLEGIKYYGLVQGIAIDEIQLLVDQLFSYDVGSLFYFGKNTVANLNAIDCFYNHLTTLENKLYETNISANRNITFTNVSYHKRKYMPDILFTDEGEFGKNYGSVYVDPTNGNDENFGFNKNDAVQTFDAALIRVQNQSTINPVKVIRIKDGATVLKDVTIKEIENCNLLITGYTDGGEGVSKPRIYFEVTNDIILIGGFKILGNVSLYFRNVDLICNPYYQLPTQLNQKTIFNLYHAYCKIVFDNLEIDLAHSYSLIKSVESNSSIETKFVDTNIIGTSNSSLSPSNNGIINLLVDNSQIGSVLSPSIYSQFNTGWLDANTIRNNF